MPSGMRSRSVTFGSTMVPREIALTGWIIIAVTCYLWVNSGSKRNYPHWLGHHCSNVSPLDEQCLQGGSPSLAGPSLQWCVTFGQEWFKEGLPSLDGPWLQWRVTFGSMMVQRGIALTGWAIIAVKCCLLKWCLCTNRHCWCMNTVDVNGGWIQV